MSKDNDYQRGYCLGYLEAIQFCKNLLVIDEEYGVLRLTTLVNALDDKETRQREMWSELLSAPPVKVDKKGLV